MTIHNISKARMKPVSSIISGLFVVSLLIPQGVSGQEKNEEVTIIAPYNPTVTSAQKINRNPRINMEDTGKLPEVEYSINSERINTKVTPEAPVPSRKPGEPSKDLYRSHLRAGFGNYMTPYFELWVNSLQSDEFSAGAHIAHISSLGKIKDYANSQYSNTMLEAFGKKFYSGGAFGAGLSYKRNMVHRYGFKPDDFPSLDIPDDEIKQVYQKIGFNLGLESNNEADNAFNYYVLFDGYYYFDKYESKETGLFFRPGFGKKLDLFGNDRSSEIGLDINLDYYMNKDSIGNHNEGILGIRPFFDMDLSPYRIYAGLQVDYRLDTVSSKFHLYPVIMAEANILEDVMVVYAGIKGGLQRNSFESLSSENPFMNSIVPFDYTNNKFEIYGGVKGRVSELVDYNVQVRNSTFDNLALFVTDTSNKLGNTFNVIYDNGNRLDILGELGFRSKSDFGLLLKAGYHYYSMSTEEKAWHRPGLTAGFDAYFILMTKLTLSMNFTANSGIYAKTYSGNDVVAEMMNGWLDLGIGAEYRINDRFSAFLKLNNLLNQGYQRWYNYPVQKLNALAGVGFSF